MSRKSKISYDIRHLPEGPTLQQMHDVMRMEAESFKGRDSWAMEDYLENLKDSIFIAAQIRGSREIVGYAMLSSRNDNAYLTNMVVAKKAQHQGIGGQLMNDAMDTARCRGFDQIELEVRVENRRAIKLYEGLGLTAQGVVKNYYGRGQHAVIYRGTTG